MEDQNLREENELRVEDILNEEAKPENTGIPSDEPQTEENPSGEERTEEPRSVRAKKRRAALISDLIFFVVSFLVIYILFNIFPPYYVDGNSMNQTLKDRAFGFGTTFYKLDYGDIVVLHGDSGKTNDNDFIKRIVGKPGDILEITDGVLVRNGEPVYEDYAYYDPDYTYRSGVTKKIKLEEGEYYVMGDNRFHSMDSRVFGPIRKSEIKCKMLFFLWGKKRK